MAATRGGRAVPILKSVAGPSLIVASVLIPLRGFWLGARLTNQHVDLLAFWLPRWCHLGESLADGRLPTWLPNQFGGVPFLSDPQSGWLSIPVVTLFPLLPCARALGLVVTLLPVLGGLGLFWFLRGEGAGRTAATVAGLTLALGTAGSVVALSMPFAGTLAWTPVALAGASRYVRARRWGPRLGWLGLTELGLAQVAASHLSGGLAMAALLVGLFLVARSMAQVREGTRGTAGAVGLVVLVFAAFPLLAAAVLVPRLALLPGTAVGQGYAELARLGHDLTGVRGQSPLATRGLGPWWPTGFARGPGAYLGSLAVLLAPAAFLSRRWRAPAAAFALAGALGWVLTLDALVRWEGLRRFAIGTMAGEVWLRDPSRFRYLVLIALAALAGYGLQAWLDLAADRARRRRWLPATPAASALLFVGLPLLAGARPSLSIPFAAGAAASVPLLVSAGRDRRRAPALAVALALELVVTALVGQSGRGPPPPHDRLATRASPGLDRAFSALRPPAIEAGSYAAAGPIGRRLARSGPSRYLAVAPPGVGPRGFLFRQRKEDWAAYQNGRDVLFGLENVLGYSPVQLDRYWRLLRAVNRGAFVFFNAAWVRRPHPALLRLFAVGWVIEPAGATPDLAHAPRRGPRGHEADHERLGPIVAREGEWLLRRVRRPAPRASIATAWRTVGSGAGLREVLSPAFDPPDSTVVEGATPPPPRSAARRASASARYREVRPEHVVVDVRAQGPALLVVRNAWDRNWEARVDGRPAPVLVADYAFQGVRVPPGRHRVELRYRDGAVGAGAAASTAAWSVLLLAAALLARRPGRRE